jgi:pSer/pThr/pTyr-binding forkhead associated (FHA) protein
MGIWLAMATADGSERLYAISKPRTVIGREVRCDLRVPIRTVANTHCEIIICRGRLRLRDLGSEFGTFVNGERISETLLHKSDHIRLGPVTFTVRNGMHERHNRSHAPHNSSETTLPSDSKNTLVEIASLAQPPVPHARADGELV